MMFLVLLMFCKPPGFPAPPLILSSNRPDPTEITLLGAEVTAVAAGGYHTAVISGGKLYTFGFNEYGQLGIDTFRYGTKKIPTEITFFGANATAVAAGSYHTAVISSGKLYTFGQLGIGKASRRSNPTEIAFSGANVTAVAAGYSHTAVISGGKLYTFGSNEYGQLGDGTTSSKYSPTEIPYLGTGTELSAVFAGWDQTAVIQCATGMRRTVCNRLVFGSLNNVVFLCP